MTELRLPIATIIVAICALAIAMHRTRRPGPDFFVGSIFCFALVYGIVPLSLPWMLRNELGLWGWIRDIPIDSLEFGCGLLLALLSLISFWVAYAAAESWVGRPLGESQHGKELALSRVTAPAVARSIAICCGAIGAVALVAYILAIGGFLRFLVDGFLYRSGENPSETPWLFLKTLAQLLVPSSFIWFGLYGLRHDGIVSAKLAFWLTFAMSILLLFHLGGRMQLAGYLVAFPLAWLAVRRLLTWRNVIALGSVSVLFVLFGRELFWLARDPNAIFDRVGDVSGSFGQSLTDILLEFSYPSLSIARTLGFFDSNLGLRHFVDFPGALLNILPDRISPVPPIELFTQVLGGVLEFPIPPDLVSMGLVSGGFLGVAVFGVALGAACAWLDANFSEDVTPLQAIFKFGWLPIVSLRVMYAEPFHLLAGNFGLIVATLLILYFSRRSKIVLIAGTPSDYR